MCAMASDLMTILPKSEVRKKLSKEHRERERQMSGQGHGSGAIRHDHHHHHHRMDPSRGWPYGAQENRHGQKRKKVPHSDRDRLRIAQGHSSSKHVLQGSTRKVSSRDPSSVFSSLPLPSSTNTLSRAQRSPAGNNSDDEYGSGFRNDELERTFAERLRKERGLVIKDMRGDGNCLFRAVAFHVYSDEEMHMDVRRLCFDYMEKNRDHFSQFLTEDFPNYVARKRRLDTHGNHLEIQAISEMYARPIEIYEYSIDPMNVFHPESHHSPSHSHLHLHSQNAPLRLSYHGSCHYNAVFDPHRPTFGVGLGLPGLDPGSAERQLIQDVLQTSDSDEIEKAMLHDKMRLTDWQRTEEDLADQIAHSSYMEYVRSVGSHGGKGGGSPKRTMRTTPPRSGIPRVSPPRGGMRTKARSPVQGSSKGHPPHASHSSSPSSSSSSFDPPCHSRSAPQLSTMGGGEGSGRESSRSPPQMTDTPGSSGRSQGGTGLYEEMLAMGAYSEWPEDMEEESMLAQAILLSQQEFISKAGSSRKQ